MGSMEPQFDDIDLHRDSHSVEDMTADELRAEVRRLRAHIRDSTEYSEIVEDGLSTTAKRLSTQVEKLEIDPVTGLFRRNILEQKLNDLIRELNTIESRRKSPLEAVLVVAIDLD